WRRARKRSGWRMWPWKRDTRSGWSRRRWCAPWEWGRAGPKRTGGTPGSSLDTQATSYWEVGLRPPRHPPGDRERAITILGDALEEAGEYSMKGVQADALALKLDLEASAPATPLEGGYSRKTGSGFVGCVTIQPAITFASVAWKPAFGKRVRTSRTNSAGRPEWLPHCPTSFRAERPD